MTLKLHYPFNIPYLTAIIPHFSPFSTAPPPWEALRATEVVPSQHWRIPGFGNPWPRSCCRVLFPCCSGSSSFQVGLFFSKLQKGKKKKKVGRSFPLSFVLLGIKARIKEGEERKVFLCFRNVSFQFETKLNLCVLLYKFQLGKGLGIVSGLRCFSSVDCCFTPEW